MRKLTDEQKIEIVEKYTSGGYTCCGLGREYNVSHGTIINILRVRNIRIENDMSILKRIYPIDDTFFDIIDTEEKAYFLGLLYADGYNKEDRGAVSIELQEEDTEILDKFIIALKYIGKTVYLNDRTKEKPTTKKTSILHIGCKKISQALVRLGCHQRKSLTLKFPTSDQVPEHLLRHFIRGYFDGDGSISTGFVKGTTSLRLHCNITSTKDFCNDLSKIINREVKVNSIVNKCGTSNTITSRVDVNGAQQIFKMIKWMYEDSTIFLQRKYNKYLSIKNEMIKRKLIQ